MRKIVNSVKRLTACLPNHEKPADAHPSGAPGSIQEMIMKLPENHWSLLHVVESYEQAALKTRRTYVLE